MWIITGSAHTHSELWDANSSKLHHKTKAMQIKSVPWHNLEKPASSSKSTLSACELKATDTTVFTTETCCAHTFQCGFNITCLNIGTYEGKAMDGQWWYSNWYEGPKGTTSSHRTCHSHHQDHDLYCIWPICLSTTPSVSHITNSAITLTLLNLQPSKGATLLKSHKTHSGTSYNCNLKGNCSQQWYLCKYLTDARNTYTILNFIIGGSFHTKGAVPNQSPWCF